MEIIIHGSMKRFKYISDFLMPRLPYPVRAMLDNGDGNIKSYISAYKTLPRKGDTWHFEDDVLPDRRLIQWMVEMEDVKGIVCGFGTTEKFGYIRDPEDMWYSFPCIRIPNKYIHRFLDWIETSGDEDVARRMELGKGIDFLFHKYVVAHPTTIYHHNPCMVEHIDEYIGGSLINERDKPIRAIRFEDTERLEELKRWVGGIK